MDWNEIANVFKRYGIPETYWRSRYTGNPNDAFGVASRSGDPRTLSNPITNAMVAAPSIAADYQASFGNTANTNNSQPDGIFSSNFLAGGIRDALLGLRLVDFADALAVIVGIIFVVLAFYLFAKTEIAKAGIPAIKGLTKEIPVLGSTISELSEAKEKQEKRQEKLEEKKEKQQEKQQEKEEKQKEKTNEYRTKRAYELGKRREANKQQRKTLLKEAEKSVGVNI